MASYAWNASTGGDWNTASDWTPATVPGAADTTLFATGGNAYTVTGDGDAGALTVDADQVTFEGAITTGTLTATDGAGLTVDQSAFFTVSDVESDATALLQVSGLLIDEGGGTASVAFVSGADAQFVAASAVTFDQLYVNNGGTYAGDVTLNDGGNVTLDTSAVFGGGTLTLAGSGTVYVANTTGQSTGSYGLSDTIVLGGGGLTLASDPGVALNVTGAISGAGYLDVNGGSVGLSGFNTYTGGTIVDGATLTLTGAGAAGTGALFLNNAALVSDADSSGGAGSQTVVGSGGADTVTANAGGLLVFASDATSFTFQGGTGASTVIGGSGALIATGGTGGDTIFGGTSGSDSLSSGAGPATLVGGNGGLLTAIGSAANLLVASAGNTTLNGAGSTGNDVYFTGGTGISVVEGGSGDSTVVAGGATNSVYGGTGTENVFLAGGMTQLDFVEGFNGGTMNVNGFGSGDTLHLANYAADETQSVLNSAVVDSGNTILTFSDNTHVVLFGFTGLSASNFG